MIDWQFNIGDTVEIMDERFLMEHEFEYPGIDSAMLKYAGGTFKIQSRDFAGGAEIYRINSWWWRESWLLDPSDAVDQEVFENFNALLGGEQL